MRGGARGRGRKVLIFGGWSTMKEEASPRSSFDLKSIAFDRGRGQTSGGTRRKLTFAIRARTCYSLPSFNPPRPSHYLSSLLLPFSLPSENVPLLVQATSTGRILHCLFLVQLHRPSLPLDFLRSSGRRRGRSLLKLGRRRLRVWRRISRPCWSFRRRRRWSRRRGLE